MSIVYSPHYNMGLFGLEKLYPFDMKKSAVKQLGGGYTSKSHRLIAASVTAILAITVDAGMAAAMNSQAKPAKTTASDHDHH